MASGFAAAPTLGLGLLASLPAYASSDGARLLDRQRARAEILAQQAHATLHVASELAKIAYRLERRRVLAFFGHPESRLAAAEAANAAVRALARALAEARLLSDEADRARAEERMLQERLSSRPPGGPEEARPGRPAPPLRSPVAGPIVAWPGSNRDVVTGVTTTRTGLVLLARMNQSVRVPGPGTVRRVEAQPQGGFAVVLDHGAGWTSVVTGLRDVSIAPGQAIDGGSTMGLAGRNLDGAPVVSWELRRERTLHDPRLALRKAP